MIAESIAYLLECVTKLQISVGYALSEFIVESFGSSSSTSFPLQLSSETTQFPVYQLIFITNYSSSIIIITKSYSYYKYPNTYPCSQLFNSCCTSPFFQSITVLCQVALNRWQDTLHFS